MFVSYYSGVLITDTSITCALVINGCCIFSDFIEQNAKGNVLRKYPAIDASFYSIVQLESQFRVLLQQLIEGKFVTESQLEGKEGEIILITQKNSDGNDVGDVITLVIVSKATKPVEVVFGIEVYLLRIQIGLFTTVE